MFGVPEPHIQLPTRCLYSDISQPRYITLKIPNSELISTSFETKSLYHQTEWHFTQLSDLEIWGSSSVLPFTPSTESHILLLFPLTPF